MKSWHLKDLIHFVIAGWFALSVIRPSFPPYPYGSFLAQRFTVN